MPIAQKLASWQKVTKLPKNKTFGEKRQFLGTFDMPKSCQVARKLLSCPKVTKLPKNKKMAKRGNFWSLLTFPKVAKLPKSY